MAITQVVKDSWQANEQVNKVLLEHLTPKMLSSQTPGGGYTVAQHLAHMVATKKFWCMKLNESVSQLPNLFFEKTDTTFVVETNLAQIKDVMRQTSQKILETSENVENKGTLTHPSVEEFLIHMMIHDGHHRGQILLALKTAGHPLPNEDLFWQPLNHEFE